MTSRPIRYTRRRHIRLEAMQDDALAAIARQRTCEVSALFREAVTEYFSLPTSDSQANSLINKLTKGASDDH